MPTRFDPNSCRRILCLASALAAMTGNVASAQTLQGQYCRVAAPPGWAISAEMPTRSSFGADLRRADGAAHASYFLVGVAAAMRSSPWYGRFYATPEQGVLATLSKMGTEPVKCGPSSAVSASQRVMQCRTPGLTGAVMYQAQAMPDGGYLLAIRTAAAPHAQWARFIDEAGAVATALRCNVPFLPAPPEPRVDPGSASSKAGGKGEAKSRYNPWRGTEEYHDPKTGENHEVNPSRQWDPVGPQGPGPYVWRGNEKRKLEPGRSD